MLPQKARPSSSPPAISYTHCWAKTTEDGHPGTSVHSHSLAVGFVMKELVKLYNGYNTQIWPFLASTHDIGKISPGFLWKCPKWVAHYNLKPLAALGSEANHAKVSQFTLARFLAQYGNLANSAKWACAIGAHHGQHYGLNLQESVGMEYTSPWEEERLKLCQQLSLAFPCDLTNINQTELVWAFAGLLTIADWIGSDEENFPPNKEISPADAESMAALAVSKTGLKPIQCHNTAFQDVFGFTKNDLQTLATNTITEPGTYVIEAPMGIGKTEAALAVAQHLINTRQARGIYVALPTRTTSDRIHRRVEEFAKKIFPEEWVKLSHSTAWLSTRTPNSKDAREAQEWFKPSRKGLLTNIGVGTVDQCLMAVLQVKFFTIRRAALMGKVVIIDEAHSYDAYTGTLITQLSKIVVALGGTVVILSATLSTSARRSILGVDINNTDYPCITGITRSGHTVSTACPPPSDKQVRIKQESDEEATINDAIERARQGLSVLFICNTVAQAQEVYLRIKSELVQGDPDIGLLHSRFTPKHRLENESKWLTRLGKDGQRTGCILVSTQVVEQSVDIDADFLITYLAPIDMLFQRIGRLWRHKQTYRIPTMPECTIITPAMTLKEAQELPAEKLKQHLGVSAKVYSPYRLLRTLQTLSNLTTLNIPSQIRPTIEENYSAQNEPRGWAILLQHDTKRSDALRARATVASDIWNLPEIDDNDEATRLCIPTVDVVLIPKEEASHYNFSSDRFNYKDALRFHENTVRLPDHIFESREAKPYIKTNGPANSVHGLLDGNDVNNLQLGRFTVSYTKELGARINRTLTITGTDFKLYSIIDDNVE